MFRCYFRLLVIETALVLTWSLKYNVAMSLLWGALSFVVSQSVAGMLISVLWVFG